MDHIDPALIITARITLALLMSWALGKAAFAWMNRRRRR